MKIEKLSRGDAYFWLTVLLRFQIFDLVMCFVSKQLHSTMACVLAGAVENQVGVRAPVKNQFTALGVFMKILVARKPCNQLIFYAIFVMK